MYLFYFLNLIFFIICTIECVCISYKRLNYEPILAECIKIEHILFCTKVTYRYSYNSKVFIKKETIPCFIPKKKESTNIRLFINPKKEKVYISDLLFKEHFIADILLMIITGCSILSLFF